MSTKKGLVYGFGVNDLDYPATKAVKLDGKLKIIWQCPYHRKWVEMLKHCYSEKFLLIRPSYKGCSTEESWKRLSVFKLWMENQDWEGKCLDKDLLFPGNKVYGPDTCLLIDKKVNSFLTERKTSIGSWPVGVDFHKASGKYQALGLDVITGKRRHLGLFIDPDDAHQAWLYYKLEQAKILASQQTDERVAKALVARYENYQSF